MAGGGGLHHVFMFFLLLNPFLLYIYVLVLVHDIHALKQVFFVK